MRIPGEGRLVLIGGGEFTFGETEEVDRAWIDLLSSDGPVGFVPTASGSIEYGEHFATYLRETFDRHAETIPIYRTKDARRVRNGERIEAAAAVYVGGGLADHLLDALPGSPAEEALQRVVEREGGMIVAISAGAQTFGARVRSPTGRGSRSGLGWLPGIAIEANFDPDHTHRLAQALAEDGVETGLGIPAGSAVIFGPGERIEVLGVAWTLTADGELEELESVG